MERRTIAIVVTALLVAAACASGEGAAVTTPPPSGAGRSVATLKLLVLRAVGGGLDYCDPDLYPVQHGSALQNAEARLPQIRADAAVYRAILAFERIPSDASLTPERKIAVNEDYKQIQAIDLHPSGGGFAFTVLVPAQDSPTGNRSISGTVDRSGLVHRDAPGAGRRNNCPICLAAGTLIAMPGGAIRVQDILMGMRVWTTGRDGRPMIRTVVRTGHTLAPVGHHVVRLSLADGRTVFVSPGHPTADGRRVGDLRPGERFDGSVVATATLVAYVGLATFDLLPSGPTGTYFANGILLGSTLSRSALGARGSVDGTSDRLAAPRATI
jgi:hypothetical protein